MKRMIFAAVASGLFLSACSGGGGGVGASLDAAAPDVPGISADRPLSGTARYSGFMTVDLPTQTGPTSYTGALGLDVDFDAADVQITGAARNFTAAGGDDLVGNLLVTDGIIDAKGERAADYVFKAGVSGTLRGADFRNMVITGRVQGAFAGAEGSVLSGNLSGETIGPTGADVFRGSFSSSAD